MSDTQRPWLTPDETLEALEVMADSANCMRNVAEFGSLRRELRMKLKAQVQVLELFIQAHHTLICDESLMLGVAAMAEQKKTTVIYEMRDALEKHVSEFNRRK